MENQAQPVMSPDEAVLALIIELRQGSALMGQQLAILRGTVQTLEAENEELRSALADKESNVSRINQSS